jgi:hypothetical protein
MDLVTLDEIELITLPDGSELDARQSLAVFLRATTDLEITEIAEHANYSSRSACSHFLRSNRGKAGIQHAITQHLIDGARVGIQTMVKLARSAKSENVRQMAAADLLDRAGYKAQETQATDTVASGRELNININLGDAGITIDGNVADAEEVPAKPSKEIEG